MDKFDIRIIPEFTGGAGDMSDILKWLEKLILICELRGISDIAPVIPLRLGGDAFEVYAQLPTDDKKNVAKVKEALTKAFSIDCYSAYERFSSRRLKPGETVDAFLADLKRLGSICGGVPDKLLQCAFVAGLPDSVRLCLRSSSKIESMDLNDLVNRARIILADVREEAFYSPAAAGAGFGGDASYGDQLSPAAAGHERENSDPIICRTCNGPNHYSRDCVSKNAAAARFGKPNARRSVGLCYVYGAGGHYAASCPKNAWGQSGGQDIAASVFPHPVDLPLRKFYCLCSLESTGKDN